MSYPVDVAQTLVLAAAREDHQSVADIVNTIPHVKAGEVIAALATFAAIYQKRAPSDVGRES